MQKKKIVAWVMMLLMLYGCSSLSSLSNPVTDTVVSVALLPIKIVAVAIAAAIGAAAGMGWEEL